MLKVYVSRLDRSNILSSTKVRCRSRERRGGSLCVLPCDISVWANPCDTLRDLRKCCFSTRRSVCLGKQGPKFLTERWVYNGPGAGSANQRVHKASCAGGRRELNELQQEDADGKLEVMEGLQMTHIADEMQSNEGVAELTIVTKRGGHAKHPEAEEEKRHLGKDKLGSFDGDLREVVNSLDMSSKDGDFGDTSQQNLELNEDLTCVEIMERWEFLKKLPHKLLRDIGYVTAGPSLLLNSRELPVVSTAMMGASRSQWPHTKAWLQQLPIPELESWFASQRLSTRLGDHFALCIEYILRFSPLIETHRLVTSQQVLQMITKPLRTKTWNLTTSAVPVPRSKSRSRALLPISSVPDDQQESLRETVLLLDSADLNDNNLKPLRGNQGERLGKRKRKLLRKQERLRLRKGATTTVGEFDFLFEGAPESNLQALESDVTERKMVQHWEVSVKFLLYAGPWEVFGVKTPDCAAWSNREVEHVALQSESSMVGTGTNATNHDTNIYGLSKVDPGARKNEVFPDLDVEDGSSMAEDDSEPIIDNKTVTVSHVHVGGSKTEDVEDLDPTGGPESSSNDVQAVLVHCNGSEIEVSADSLVKESSNEPHFSLEQLKHVDEFLGCFLGPHVGETLFDRKARLCNQLALSDHPCAALVLQNLFADEELCEPINFEQSAHKVDTSFPRFDSEREGREEGPTNRLHKEEEPILAGAAESSAYVVDDNHEQDVFVDADLEDVELIRGEEDPLDVVPSALLKGYLFYEYKLWRLLQSQKQVQVEQGMNASTSLSASNPDVLRTSSAHVQATDLSTCKRENLNVADHRDEEEAVTNGRKADLSFKSSLNINHWMGWWTRDITEFAYLPLHHESMWYIVPKLEWLSPVSIPASDAEKCACVLTLENLIAMAAKVAEEAGRLDMPRKRRFLVAEMHWEADQRLTHEMVECTYCDRKESKDSPSIVADSSMKCGSWVEASRGFIVEETWPVSRLYTPHGYVTSWSSSLQRSHLEEDPNL